LGILAGRIAGRPVWLAASTHRGEDEAVLQTHGAIAAQARNVLTIIVPRHPERGESIAELARAKQLRVALRSRGETPDAETQIYVADTIGELGIFYRLAPLVFMGGSLIPHGGQNPIEPAKLGVAILHGPHVFNFTDVFGLIGGAGGAQGVIDAEALARAAGALILDPAAMRRMGTCAHDAVIGQSGATARTIQAIAAALDQRAQRQSQAARP
ncbi:MAG: 3-deoxy-D-manno-octulosonic acid transferase, partial [Beijerinckiaceae bacterium]